MHCSCVSGSKAKNNIQFDRKDFAPAAIGGDIVAGPQMTQVAPQQILRSHTDTESETETRPRQCRENRQIYHSGTFLSYRCNQRGGK